MMTRSRLSLHWRRGGGGLSELSDKDGFWHLSETQADGMIGTLYQGSITPEMLLLHLPGLDCERGFTLEAKDLQPLTADSLLDMQHEIIMLWDHKMVSADECGALPIALNQIVTSIQQVLNDEPECSP